ncbi:BgTH12-05522 [Blumeria graminis f. sp. triticale]|uniref:BgTH12-05522 n=1 Tax=Blumeria graminis f. sp. triticale TaxID=1689686 RepID=A0A9W4D8B9_BLUGR|nr:BgTH12-05522 [Blumeria graminis f. sp. triticale]
MYLQYDEGIPCRNYLETPKVQKNSCTPQRFSSRKASPTLGPLGRRNTINESSGLRRSLPKRPLSEHLVQPNLSNDQLSPNYDREFKKEIPTSISDKDNRMQKENSKQRNKFHKKASVFYLAHPAPTLTQTQKFLQIRPKLLLQLQLLTAQTRPKPSLDVIPSTVLVPRLAKKFPRLFRGRRELGSNDVIIVKSEDYDTAVESSEKIWESGNSDIAKRDLLAVICQMPRDRGASQGVAEIVLSDGSVCTATPLPGGIYEIQTTDKDGHQIIAHWWIKKYPKRTSIESLDYANINADLHYAFSIIESNTRKNPIMATISHKSLEILDSYSAKSSLQGNYHRKPSVQVSTKCYENPESLSATVCSTYQIDEKMEALIQVTGIWVSLRQGWCPNFKYNDAIAIACSSTCSQPGGRSRSSSMTPHTNLNCSDIDILDLPDSTISPRVTSFGNIMRQASLRCRKANQNSSTIETKIISQKKASSGTAFVQRVAASRMSHTPSTISNEFEKDPFNVNSFIFPENFNGDEVKEVSKLSQLPTTYSPKADPDTNSRTRGLKQTLLFHNRCNLLHEDFSYDARSKKSKNTETIHRTRRFKAMIAGIFHRAYTINQRSAHG